MESVARASRQLRMIHRRRLAGLCAQCGKVQTPHYRCDTCRAANTAGKRRATGYQPHSATGLGRPPFNPELRSNPKDT